MAGLVAVPRRPELLVWANPGCAAPRHAQNQIAVDLAAPPAALTDGVAELQRIIERWATRLFESDARCARIHLPHLMGHNAALPVEARARKADGIVASVRMTRRWYAEELRFTASLRLQAVIAALHAAFGNVPRERFVGPGP